MFKLHNDGLLEVSLPQGRTQAELVPMAEDEIDRLIETGATYGKNVKINGRCTTGMALMLGHKLAHVCKSVSIFSPADNQYIQCIRH